MSKLGAPGLPSAMLAAMAVAVLNVSPGAVALGAEAMLAPTPLILRDGRIAHVSVHVLPFDAGAERLGAAVDRELATLGRAIATDCFLTAQVIGHVEPGEAAEGDTLAAHRLARARADAVQRALVARGLPERAIASVWDWQFLVREPRATLWVFRLSEGEDCDGMPLVAADLPLAEADPGPPELVEAEPEPPAPSPEEPLVAEPETPEPPPAVELAEEAPAEIERAEPPPAEPAEEAPVVAAPTEAIAEEPAEVGEIEVAADEIGRVEIAFDVNSSYFPRGATGQLGELFERLAEGGRYAVELVATVSAGDVRGAQTQAEALHYNRWLASRRVERVEEWLQDNVTGSELDIEHDFVEDDSSRRVIVRVRPLR